jgi:hypothetical protein
MTYFYLYALITSPGVMVHELAHAFFCVLSGTKIFKISLFRFNETAGYVVHAEPRGFFPAFLITFGPLIVNSYLAMYLFTLLDWASIWWSLLFLWLAIAIGLHAIPSRGDAKSLFQSANRKIWRNPLVILFYPFVLLIYILNLLKKLYFDIIYVAFLWYVAINYFIKYL